MDPDHIKWATTKGDAERVSISSFATRFNANRADGFWARRTTIAKAEVIVMKAAAVNKEVGHHQSKVIYQEYPPPQGVIEAVDRDEYGDEAEAENENKAETEAESESDDQGEDEDENGGGADEAKDDFFNDEEMSSLLANIAEA
ncbi:hypothetical protein BGZ80_004468 [Entomortierella chlamydospora]|uniref:Uncharacterized protein n=1 Tax=Entomortierella chlamydospora TaxID=101097 RepID=A0A9P6MM82_9FUNG|nr:hypothetical protein BGZ79_001400 [Entomortierella chlamydospora]KAG0007599.1 hypothetical protein BGZ80_004468 [Entomortierella chlamydospora]